LELICAEYICAGGRPPVSTNIDLCWQDCWWVLNRQHKHILIATTTVFLVVQLKLQ